MNMEEMQTKILALVDSGQINNMTYGDMAKKLDLKYRSQPRHYIEKMIADGVLVRSPEGKLARQPSADNRSLITLPVMGTANCGQPTIYANNAVEGVIHISPAVMGKQRVKPGMFAVKASGNSMNAASINGSPLSDGDYAVISPMQWQEAAEGDYILSVIDGMGNIKRLRLDPANSRIILKSESNEYFEDIILQAEDLYLYQIAGKVVAVVKGDKVS